MKKKINKNKEEKKKKVGSKLESNKKTVLNKKKIKTEEKISEKGKDGSLEREDNSESLKKIKIKVIGIGGGGSNIVFELSKRLKEYPSQKIDFIAVNTDNQALNSVARNMKILSFGNKVTNGLGCGSDVLLGERAAQEDIEKVKNIFSDGKDLYIIVSSLGGGTGTGAAPVFARMANSLKLNTLSIFTLPFVFEGKKKADNSALAIEKLKESVNAYMVLPNEKIFSLSKEELSFSEALSLLNDHLATCLEGLFRTIYNPGLINIDWADIKTVLEGNKKIAYIDVMKIKSSQNLEEFAKKILENPILDYNFENADNLIFNIESPKDLSLQLLSQISERISVHVPNARIIFGLTQNPKLKNEIKITIFSTISDLKNINTKENKGAAVKSRIKPVIKDGELSLSQEEGKKEKKIEKKKEKIAEKSKSIEKKKGNKIDIDVLLEEKDVLVKTKEDEEKKIEDDVIKEEKKDDFFNEEKIIRRNAIETKELERLQREQEDKKEKMFDIPAFLRKDKKNKK